MKPSAASLALTYAEIFFPLQKI